MSQINFKRGDTFTLTCTYKVDGLPSSIDDVDIASQVRNQRDELIQNLSVTKLEELGQFTLNASASETSDWPIKVLRCDVQFTQGNTVRSTQTFDISVVKDITR